jgi:hypothetical protein
MNPSARSTLDQAQACLARGDGQQAVQLMQDAALDAAHNPAVLTGLGVALRFTGRLAEAANAFSSALALEPGRADAQVYLGMIRLAQGQQEVGWALYQARWRNASWTDKLRYPEKALWNGQVTPGLKLLLWGEQGLGDIIQFSRYAPWLLRLLKNNGASLALEVPETLCNLLTNSWSFMNIYRSNKISGHFDAHLPLMDLPHLWGDRVGQGGLPYLPLPYLSALPDLFRDQRGVASPSAAPFPCDSDLPKPLHIGIAWQGRPSHPDDRLRSIPILDLEALFAIPGLLWVSLHKDAGPHPAWLPRDLSQCRDFSDSARIVDGLDLVITIDSAMAHLAGALGKAVWLLLPRIADWRWLSGATDTPWYPNMRLFRQGETENWPAVVQRAASALKTLRAAHCNASESEC